MGTCVTKIRQAVVASRFPPGDDPESSRESRKIDFLLRHQEQEDRNMIKLLLLGSGNSGKSTVMKQFKIIHKRGFTVEERRVFRDALWKSAIESMRTLVRQRQDLINAMHLGDADYYPTDGSPSTPERDLIDASMEPYFQFLLFRVRNDQPLYEEVIVPVAAEASPRADFASPNKEVKKSASGLLTSGASVISNQSSVARSETAAKSIIISQKPQLPTEGAQSNGTGKEPARPSILPVHFVDETFAQPAPSPHSGGAAVATVATSVPISTPFVPLLTSTTIVLSSPPPAERKRLIDTPDRDGVMDDDDNDGERNGNGNGHAHELMPPVDLDAFPENGEHSGSFALPEAAVSIVGTVSTESSSKKKKKKKSKHREEPFVSSNGSEGDNSFDNSQKLEEAVNEDASDASSSDKQKNESLLLDGDFRSSDLSGPAPTAGSCATEEESKEPEWEGKSSKKMFETLEEEVAHLAKLERRKRRKKRREKLKRKQLEELDASIPSRSGHKKAVSASSVESFRSDLSRSQLGAQKSGAPMVTWEKMTVGRLLQKVWMDPLIQRCWALEEKSPQLEEPLGYIMNAMDRLADEGFQPTNEDILFARKRTSGVNLLDFEAYGAKFLLIDVGGQRTERKKWLAHFDIVDAVIFVVGLDQYDQVMMEDGVTNRLRDSLELFEEMCSSPWFRSSSFLLFLNKSDVFKTKIKQVPITVCFRAYQGDPHDYDQASKYIIRRFQQIHTQHANILRDVQPRGRAKTGRQATPHVYPYMTNATDTESMRFVIDTCQDILLRSEMAQWGFFDF